MTSSQKQPKTEYMNTEQRPGRVNEFSGSSHVNKTEGSKTYYMKVVTFRFPQKKRRFMMNKITLKFEGIKTKMQEEDK